ncbi:MAG: hypothetical protein CMJ31_15080 [Phycisphaerae bacterium]|nr:hypothetical protein [Phycisphaerae bacterium]
MKSAVTGLVAILVGFVAVRLILPSEVAATPISFQNTPALSEAVAQAQSEGKAVVAVVTADWCGPCQKLKGETLSDPRVAGFIEAHALPVYLEDKADRDTIASLQVTGYPTTLVFRDGEEIARAPGYAPAADYLAFLERTLGDSAAVVTPEG